VQEVLIARQLTICFGTFRIDWRIPCLFLRSIEWYRNAFCQIPELETHKGSVKLSTVEGEEFAFAFWAILGSFSCGVPRRVCIIGSKHALQTRNSTIEMALWESVACFGLQQCSYRHEAVFGLLGMAKGSYLLIDYLL
jgi:hypothetical protein